MDYGTWVFVAYSVIALAIMIAQAIENQRTTPFQPGPSPIVTGLLWPVWVAFILVGGVYAVAARLTRKPGQ